MQLKFWEGLQGIMADQNSREFGRDSRMLDQGSGLRGLGREGAFDPEPSSNYAGDHARSSRPGCEVEYIYFAASKGEIKIGISRDVKQRLTQLKTARGELELLGTIKGDLDLERAFHKKLKPYHVHGEWFRDCAEVRAAITHGFNCFEEAEPSIPKRDGAKMKWIGIARLLWPKKTASHLASITGKDERTGKRYLEGQNEPPGAIVAAIVAELFKREGE